MKKICMLLLTAALLMVFCTAMAEEAHTTTPEANTGWLQADINGDTVDFTYTGAAKGMTGTVYSFESEGYTMSILFDKGLKVGEAMGENAIHQIEIISSVAETAGYYFTKKIAGTPVDCEVTLSQKTDGGIWQGEFRVMVHPGDRWVGDLRPGMIQDLKVENGSFCFCEE